MRFTNARVNANARVMVNISEYPTDAQHRFIAAARVGVYNIAFIFATPNPPRPTARRVFRF